MERLGTTPAEVCRTTQGPGWRGEDGDITPVVAISTTGAETILSTVGPDIILSIECMRSTRGGDIIPNIGLSTDVIREMGGDDGNNLTFVADNGDIRRGDMGQGAAIAVYVTGDCCKTRGCLGVACNGDNILLGCLGVASTPDCIGDMGLGEPGHETSCGVDSSSGPGRR